MAAGAMTPVVARALADARPVPAWLDSPDRPEPEPPLSGDERTDLLVVGGGYSGLWAALIAKEREPDRDVVLIEGREIGWAASGRNGGFCSASLTHGLGNGLARWPDEIRELERLGAANLDAIAEAVRRYDIDCDFERTGEITVATAPHHLEELRSLRDDARHLDLAGFDLLDRDEMRAEVNSPTFLGGLRDRHGTAMLDPARLVWGLKRACLAAGVRVYEGTPTDLISSRGPGVAARTPSGRVFARQAVVATNAFRSPLRRVRPLIAPVHDFALMTEPLTPEQREAIGWRGRQGLADANNHFHYFRITADHRILWGGYDVVYHFGGGTDESRWQRPETFERLARHFLTCFPQLEGIRFTHRWGGAIDTCSRFSPFFGTAHRGRVAYAAGFTGLGVGATRFGAEVMLDLLAGARTERTAPRMVREKPLPFPPEPVRWAGIGITQWAMRREDATGRRNLWLRGLDRAGLGFDS
ncbi:NAD(P)/FAD-dependent oxidoreductase [Streptomyces calidiresistens]|uniref:FAD-dependent oxidoreductase n=1 Tax=Streptomyces calidiresistens TaxID=1485586 RepID=A0A7W3T8K5_9ACTN|nr:FAD-dependent oxidoreductase [Streptomyces calidiresistens]MBB0232661.1 FAD-dependent oxidoreductase [Streptomyces calidiresistens]